MRSFLDDLDGRGGERGREATGAAPAAGRRSASIERGEGAKGSCACEIARARRGRGSSNWRARRQLGSWVRALRDLEAGGRIERSSARPRSAASSRSAYTTPRNFRDKNVNFPGDDAPCSLRSLRSFAYWTERDRETASLRAGDAQGQRFVGEGQIMNSTPARSPRTPIQPQERRTRSASRCVKGDAEKRKTYSVLV